MSIDDYSTIELAAALRPTLMTDPWFRITETVCCEILGVEARADDVLIKFRWMLYPYTLAYGIGRDPGYGPVEDPEEWVADAVTRLGEELGTGLVAGASRQRGDDHIELVAPYWPVDERFYPDNSGSPDEAWEPATLERFERDGFDPTQALRLRDEGNLISWERSYLNGRTTPYVGHTAVVRLSEEVAIIAFCEVAPDMPETLTLDLCLNAVHAASWAGATRVVTTIQGPVLDLLGFQTVGDQRSIETDLLNMDLCGAERLLDQTRKWRAPRHLGRGRSTRRFAR